VVNQNLCNSKFLLTDFHGCKERVVLYGCLIVFIKTTLEIVGQHTVLNWHLNV